MKKIFSLISLASLLWSCSLDLAPITTPDAGRIDTKIALVGVRGGAYSMAKYMYIGTNSYYVDYLTDALTELAFSGNRGGFFSRLSLLSTDTDVRYMWNDGYRAISRVNLFLDSVDALIAENPNDTDMPQWKGEMYLLRAMLYRDLAVRFCVDYEPSTAAAAMGVPVVTTFDISLMPARGTLAQTYKRITDDIAAAKALLTEDGVANAIYLNADCVTAFSAIVALDMHDYDAAITAASAVIAKPAYALSTSSTEFKSIWGKDISNEIIFQFGLSTTEFNIESSFTEATINCSDLSYTSRGITTVAVVPEQWVVDLYDQAKDWRWNEYLGARIISDGVNSSDAIALKKFMGAENLRVSSQPNYYNRPKALTLADMYLVMAEAEYSKNGGGGATLNTFRQGRGYDVNSVTATGDELFTAIKNERIMEFIGEGRRLADLKRWNQGYTRNVQPAIGSFASPATVSINGVRYRATEATVPANYYIFMLPIPIGEFGSNINMTPSQQNPGYSTY